MIARVVFAAVLLIMLIGWYFDDRKPKLPRGSKRIQKRFARAAKREREEQAQNRQGNLFAKRARKRDRKLLQSVTWAVAAEYGDLFAPEEVLAATQLVMHRESALEFGGLFDRTVALLRKQTNQ